MVELAKKSDIPSIPSIPSVINNLTSTSTTDALSANQGKILKELIDSQAASSYEWITVGEYMTGKLTNITIGSSQTNTLTLLSFPEDDYDLTLYKLLWLRYDFIDYRPCAAAYDSRVTYTGVNAFGIIIPGTATKSEINKTGNIFINPSTKKYSYTIDGTYTSFTADFSAITARYTNKNTGGGSSNSITINTFGKGRYSLRGAI